MSDIRIRIFASIGILAAAIGSLWFYGNGKPPAAIEVRVPPLTLPVASDSKPLLVSEKAAAGRNTIASSTGTSEESQKWKSIARHTNLQLFNSESLAVSEGTIGLLGLTPTQANELNNALAGFLAHLRDAESAHAYVLVKENGDEEIVVPSFDRTPLVNQFREIVAEKLGKSVGAFCAEQMMFDQNLSVGNSEMRLYVARENDGVERVVYSREVRRKDTLDAQTPVQIGKVLFSPNVEIRTHQIARKTFDLRYQHLFAAEGSLPRRAETKKGNAPP